MKYKVFYAKTPRPLPHAGQGRSDPVTVERLPETHVFVRDVDGESKDDVFRLMQGEVWSPQGEARPLIERLGLSHTSMSVGDVVQDEEGHYWLCAKVGWTEIGSRPGSHSASN